MTGLLGAIADHVPVMLFIKEVPSLKLLLWNHEAERITGVSRDAIVGKTGAESFPPEELEFFFEKDRAVVAGRTLVEVEERITTSGGEERWLRTRKVPLLDASGSVTALLGIALDITEARRAHDALVASERKHREVLDAALHAAVAIDRAGKVTLWNRSAERIFGYAAHEALGQELAALVIPVAQRDAHRVGIARAAVPGHHLPTARRLEFTALRKDGGEFPVELALTRLGDGFLAFLSDISAQRAAQATQRLDALGRLAGGVAHDFNNLMSVVLASAEALRTDERDEDRLDDLDAIADAAGRAAALTGQLLTFSRDQPTNRACLRPPPSYNRRSRCCGDSSAKTFFSAELPDTAAVVLANASDLDQILVNLAVNARDAMPDGGSMTLSVVEEQGTAAAPPVVVLSVTDTGEGMSPETLARIFDPFFTTKAVGRGTGLGLATVYGLVDRLGGKIGVTSKPHEGSRFEIRLPVHQHPIARRPHSRLAPRTRPAGSVLLVEDDAAVRRVAARALSRTGLRVLEAESAAAALSLYDAWEGRIGLLVTDVIMPGKSGRALADELRARDASLSVLYVSGYTSELLDAEELARPRTHFLAKPFTVTSLAARVAELMAEAPPAGSSRPP
ncbi:MAG: PAS domain S-box protein [Myxococcales bacterium]|nr:PAS domain S-box protein [Myxococcales bacterium]